MLKKLRRCYKHVLYFLVFYSGLLHILISIFKTTKRNHAAIILFYHRFCQRSGENKLLPYLDISEFKKQLLHLKRLYKFISMDDLAGSISKGKYFKAPSIVVTIDDGYLDNFILAYPVLRQHGIPALIYLTAGLIGTKNGLWIDDLELALMHAQVQSFRLEEVFRTAVVDISTYRGKKKAEEVLFTRMLKLGNREREHLIQKLFDILSVDSSVIKNRPRVMLNWEEIREMSRNGISFGAHTLSHPFLSALPLEVAKHEIKESKKIVERRLGKAVKHFAIPNGKIEDFNEELKEFCKEIGFATVVSTEPGVICAQSDTHFLRRINPSPPIHIFACELARYMFFNRRKLTKMLEPGKNISEDKIN